MDHVPLQRGTPRGMLLHTAPSRSNCTAVGFAAGGALERPPNHEPRQQRGAWPSRSYSKTSITTSQTIWMSRHAVPGTTRFPGQPSRHTGLPQQNPRPPGPMRKARSQKLDVCPRKLRESSCLSLRATRLAAASRLRRSCHRSRGPVALPRSGCPVRRSRHPAAL